MSVSPAAIATVALLGSIPVVAGMVVSRYALPAIARRQAANSGSDPKQTIAMSLRGPVLLAGLLATVAIWLALARVYAPTWTEGVNWKIVDASLNVAFTLNFFYALYQVLVRGVQHAGGHIDANAKILLQRLIFVVVFAVAAMSVVNQFDINLTPLFASLGVAGLAVALGLQDTLQNYFAGVTMAVDRPLRPGDYIRLESGEEGFVESIGWRTTRIKPYSEATIIVPNNKLASSILTNQNYPNLHARVYVDCGVAYESDLDTVEKICIEVAKEVALSDPGADQDFTPLVRFKTFGDSNIQFTIVSRANTYDDTFRVKHEIIKSLTRRFRQEGIVMNYPVRDVRLPKA